jgi:hypothetical protein
MSWECRVSILDKVPGHKLPSGLRYVGAARPPAGTLWAPRHTVERVPENYSRGLVIKNTAGAHVHSGKARVSTLLLVPIGSGRGAACCLVP